MFSFCCVVFESFLGCAFATEQFASCLSTSPYRHLYSLHYVGCAMFDKEFDSDPDYQTLSAKEKGEYARCNLYRIKPEKQQPQTQQPNNKQKP